MSFEEPDTLSVPREREVPPVAGQPAPTPHATAEQVEAARKLILEAGPFRAEDLRGRLPA